MKRFIWILFITITMICCSKEDLINNETDRGLIRFQSSEALWNNVLKSTIENAELNSIPDMLIYGYHTGNKHWNEAYDVSYPTLMDAVRVINNNGAWSYESPRYFFPESNHSFLAFAPYTLIANDIRNTVSVPDSKGIPELEYYLPDEGSKQTDLLLGWAVDIASTQSSNPIEIRFIHATTKITFSAGISADYMLPPFQTIRIKSISLSNIYSYGKAKIAYNTSGDLGISWFDQGQPKDIITSISNNALKDMVLTKSVATISEIGKELYMIPQQISGRSVSVENPQITFAFEIYNTVTGISQNNIQTFDLSLLNQSWKPGKAINFQILYNGAGNPISLILIDPGTGEIIDLGDPLG